MAGGLQTTWDVLAKTRNRAVLPLLAQALRSGSAADRARAIRCSVRRHDRDSHNQLIRHFPKLTAKNQADLCNAHRAMPHHMAAALKAAVLEGDAELCHAACEIIRLCHDFELFPALVQAAESRQHRQTPIVLATIRHLAERLQRELAEWSTGDETHRRDPTFVRRNVLVTLDRALARYARHERRELIDAYLLLATCDHSPLLKMLHDRHHLCHAATLDSLANRTAPGIVEKLVELLCDSNAPASALEAIGARSDPAFIRHLLCLVKHPVPLRMLHNMKRMPAVAWLEQHREALLELDGRAQAVAVELAAASGIGQTSLFELLALLLRSGLAESRRASCNALAKFDSAEADELVRGALEDPDASVQAAAVRQVRRRGFPDALQRLVSLLDSRSIEVRDAARSSLAEFNFVRYRAMFDLLDEKALKTTGLLVHKVDHSARAGLLQELNSPSVSAKLRGIEMAVAMDATEDVCEQLVALTSSNNLSVRQEAIAALGSCHGPLALAAVRLAAEDTHPIVRNAAALSLQKIMTRETESHASEQVVMSGENR